MKFAKGSNGVRHGESTVIYNHNVNISDIPLDAYGYVVNGKPALEWVIERRASSPARPGTPKTVPTIGPLRL